MKQYKRAITYGYIVQNGNIIINPSEAIEVKKIFMSYISGQSYQKISNDLVNRKIEFLPNRYDWNKCRVKRILQNNKYLGTSSLPPIISQIEFIKVQDIISSKNETIKKADKDTVALKGHIRCGRCRKILKKYLSHNRISGYAIVNLV